MDRMWGLKEQSTKHDPQISDMSHCADDGLITKIGKNRGSIDLGEKKNHGFGISVINLTTNAKEALDTRIWDTEEWYRTVGKNV